MKKTQIIIPVVLLILLAGTVSAYLIYGSTLIDITSEESISEHLSIDSQKPITILKTAKIENYFAILYKDPLNKEYDYCFKYITKSPLYKNRYCNVGGYSNFTGSSPLSLTSVKSPEEKDTTTNVFIYYYGNAEYEYDKCTLFTYNPNDNAIDYKTVAKDEDIIKKMKALSNTYKKLDEIELPNEKAFIIAKTYNLDYSYDEMIIYDGSVSEEEAKEDVMVQAGKMVKEYHDFYLERKYNE